MSHKKNRSLAIGAFIVGAILLVFIALLFFFPVAVSLPIKSALSCILKARCKGCRSVRR